METENTSRYLKYAIGEIILVVIGILIALQINNWNESRIQRQKEIVILTEIKKELENDYTTEFIPGLEYINQKNNSLKRLMDFHQNNETIPIDSLLYYFNVSLSQWNFVFNFGGFENLRSTGINVISNDSIRSQISTIYSTEYPEIELRANTIQNFHNNEFSPILHDNVTLYSSELSVHDFDFLTNDKRIRNRIIKLYRLRQWLVTRLNYVRPIVESLINDISKEIERIE